MIGINQRSRATTVVMKMASPRFLNRIFDLLLHIRGKLTALVIAVPLLSQVNPPTPHRLTPAPRNDTAPALTSLSI